MWMMAWVWNVRMGEDQDGPGLPQGQTDYPGVVKGHLGPGTLNSVLHVGWTDPTLTPTLTLTQIIPGTMHY